MLASELLHLGILFLTSVASSQDGQAAVKPKFSYPLMNLKYLNRTVDNGVYSESPLLKKKIKLPKSFDARKKWRQCKSITHVRDQGQCGSCWAVSAAEVITDRICIAHKQKRNPLISGEDILACCKNCGDGCGGGDKEFEYWLKQGVVTGGDYDSHQGCLPYEVPPSKMQSIGVPTPKCHRTCEKSYNHTFSSDKHYAKIIYRLESVNLIQKELFVYGPVQACFQVYTDFEAFFKSNPDGIYEPDPDATPDEGHCVKLIGWGTRGKIHYWLAINSWNTTCRS